MLVVLIYISKPAHKTYLLEIFNWISQVKPNVFKIKFIIFTELPPNSWANPITDLLFLLQLGTGH